MDKDKQIERLSFAVEIAARYLDTAGFCPLNKKRKSCKRAKDNPYEGCFECNEEYLHKFAARHIE